jgi:hypothetical protein
LKIYQVLLNVPQFAYQYFTVYRILGIKLKLSKTPTCLKLGSRVVKVTLRLSVSQSVSLSVCLSVLVSSPIWGS